MMVPTFFSASNLQPIREAMREAATSFRWQTDRAPRSRAPLSAARPHMRDTNRADRRWRRRPESAAAARSDGVRA